METWSTELTSVSHPTPKASFSRTLINLENILSQQLISQYIALQAVWTTAKAAITQVYSYLPININLIAVFNK